MTTSSKAALMVGYAIGKLADKRGSSEKEIAAFCKGAHDAGMAADFDSSLGPLLKKLAAAGSLHHAAGLYTLPPPAAKAGAKAGRLREAPLEAPMRRSNGLARMSTSRIASAKATTAAVARPGTKKKPAKPAKRVVKPSAAATAAGGAEGRNKKLEGVKKKQVEEAEEEEEEEGAVAAVPSAGESAAEREAAPRRKAAPAPGAFAGMSSHTWEAPPSVAV